MLSAHLLHIYILICTFLLITIGFQLTFGFTGVINFAQMALYGVGAYTGVLLIMKFHVPHILAIFLGGFVAAGISAVITLIIARLRTDYMALGTLGLAFILHSIMLNWIGLTRGPLGISSIPKPDFFGFIINTKWEYAVYITLACLVFLFIARRITRSPYGAVLQGIRDDEVGVLALGKPVFRMKVQVMAISAFIAGVAGVIYAQYISFVDPSLYAVTTIIPVLATVVVGGMASWRGTVIGIVICMGFPELFRFLELPSTVVGPLRTMAYSVVVILFLLYRPRGLFGKADLR